MSRIQKPRRRLDIVGLTAAVAAFAAGAADADAQEPRLPQLDTFVQRVVGGAQPLALAVAVVHGDSVVHVGGYGHRDAGRAQPVTSETPFYIASSTKSFTALAAVVLAHRGAIDLDAPVGRYLPDFRLPVPLDASRVTLRHLLSHRAGFESAALAFRTAFVGDVPADSLLPLLARSAEPADTGFTYTNTAFIVAAHALARATGRDWQDVIAREIAGPLGLRRTTARPSRAAGWGQVVGYGPGPDGVAPVDPKPDATMHAGGGMLMSAADAARWLRVQLTAGRLGTRQVFPAAAIRETHRAHARQDVTTEGVRRVGYGLGWQIGLLDGDTLYHHFGNYPGAFAHVSFMPQHRVGVAVFANSEMPAFAPITGTIAQRVYDLVLQRHARDGEYAAYPDSVSQRVQRMFAIFRADFARRAARPRTPASGWHAFVGTYAAPDLGTFAIARTGDDRAELRYGVARVPLEVLAGDTLRVGLPAGRGGRPAPVELDPAGHVRRIVVNGIPFTRVDRAP